MIFNKQPVLTGPRLQLQPLKADDFERVFAAASDPLIWEQHPSRTRYQREVFKDYFQGALDSQGAFVVLDRTHGEVAGCSRYYPFPQDPNRLCIGYTFLTRKYWGGSYNYELKKLMLEHAFKNFDSVLFEIGVNNVRSRKAMEKLGGRLVGENALHGSPHAVYEVRPETLIVSIL